MEILYTVLFVTNILGYGAFVTVEDYDGLVHISEFSDNFVRSIEDFVKVGQDVRLRIIDIDDENKRLIKKSLEELGGGSLIAS